MAILRTKNTWIDKSVFTVYNGCMKIHLNNQGSLRTFGNFVSTLDFSEPEKLHISLDEKWVIVHPAHLVLAAALAKKVGKENATISKKAPTSALYLDRMGLYDFVANDSPFDAYKKNEPAGRFVPISVVKDEASQTKFTSDMIPLLHLNERNSSVISYVFGELIRNVLEHSYSMDGAFVAAQYYKKSNKVSIAICDTGIGLWKSLNLWKPRTDTDALKLALTPGISGTTLKEGGTAENAGAGLFFTKSIAKISRSYFTIYSGRAEYTLLKTRTDQKAPKLVADPFAERHALVENTQCFDGTLVAVDIALDNTKEFQQLLGEIGDAYESAIEERKKNNLRKPNFI